MAIFVLEKKADFRLAKGECVAGGRASGLIAVGVRPPVDWAASSTGIGNAGWRNVYPSIRCAALWIVKLGIAIPDGFRRRHTYSWLPQAVDGLRNSSTTVVRRMLASMKLIEAAPVDAKLLIAS